MNVILDPGPAEPSRYESKLAKQIKTKPAVGPVMKIAEVAKNRRIYGPFRLALK